MWHQPASNFQIDIPQFTFTHSSTKISENLIWFRHHVRFQNTLFQWFFEWFFHLHQNLSRELTKTDCCTLPLKLLIRKEWIYTSHKFSRDADAAGQGLLLVNHCSTPQAMSRKPTGWMRPIHVSSIYYFK